mmetsp:Transcript_6614/g.15911  ORF Transcript_6614/g.15911 Transcript_6614/m.15911 type:complete len:340 (+) Transcript_6614:890-1909(+)
MQRPEAEVCMDAARKGLEAVRRAWGSIQEAPALAALLAHLPRSTLHEVGLCCVERVPDEWGVPLSSLPNLGASPDCLVCHDIMASPELSSWIRTADTGALSRRQLEAILAEVPWSADGGDDRGSPDPFSGACADPLFPLDLPAGPPVRVVDAGDGRLRVQVVEVVEVKSSCPFSYRSRVGGPKGRPRGSWVLRSQAAPSDVRAAFIPQLQLEMLAAGAASGLLVQHTPNRGMTVKRVFRDDELLKSMLEVLRRFQSEFVVRVDRPPRPPADVFLDSRAQQTLLRKICQAAREAAGQQMWHVGPLSAVESSLALVEEERCSARTIASLLEWKDAPFLRRC